MYRALEHGLKPSLFSGPEEFQKSSGEEMVSRNNRKKLEFIFNRFEGCARRKHIIC